MDLGKYMELVDEACRNGVRLFDIAGGEPFVWKPLAELLNFIKSRNAERKVVTSGLLLDQLFQAFEANPGLISELHVSLDSQDANVHDETRGHRGLHKKVVANIQQYVQREYGPIKINYVLQRGTYLGLEGMLDFTSALGVNGIDIQCVVDVSSKTKDQDFALTVSELIETLGVLVDWVDRYRAPAFEVLIALPNYLFPIVSRMSRLTAKREGFRMIYFPGLPGSAAFSDTMYIKHTGDVTGSTSFINNDRWFIGNANSYTLKEIWEQGAPKLRGEISQRSEYMMAERICVDCPSRRFCRGGDPEAFDMVLTENYCNIKEQLESYMIRNS
jgi:radical SAM protein with 4Fe4S-binding SPASM domain